MSYRKVNFVNEEYYHVFNRGVDKRVVFEEKEDYERFIETLLEFNTEKAIGSLLEKNHASEEEIIGGKASKLVEIVAFCLNPNHFHLILKQNFEDGITKYMQRVGTGYAMYFNNKYKRSGSLFQGKFKSTHVKDNEQLLYLSAYVNLNNKIHKIENEDVISSLKEYTENTNGICDKKIIFDQFKNKDEYKKFLVDSLPELIRQKEEKRELDAIKRDDI
jgi:REP element-mobilizing transposase RayT